MAVPNRNRTLPEASLVAVKVTLVDWPAGVFTPVAGVLSTAVPKVFTTCTYIPT